MLIDFEFLFEFIDISIKSETMEKVANKLSDGAGLSDFDSAALKDLLLVYDQARKKCLQVVCVKFMGFHHGWRNELLWHVES